MTELRRALPFLVLALSLFVAGCSLLPQLGSVPTVASPEPVAGGDLGSQRAAWADQGIDDYTWQVAFGCECTLNGPTTITVVDGAVVAAANERGPLDLASIEGFPLTLDEVYDEATAAAQHGGHVTGTWGCCGVPTTLNIDRDPDTIDDELSVTVRDFTPATP